VKFLVDNQLPAALGRFLASRGVECQPVLEVGLADATDAEIWEHASRNDCVVISKDADFLYLANAPGRRRGSFGFGSGTAARRRSWLRLRVYGRRWKPG
jgi:predicted nuclease of predicted toxin-antitoxin system